MGLGDQINEAAADGGKAWAEITPDGGELST